MELSPKQQAVELVKKSQNILILTHINPDGDSLGSLMSLFLALKNLGKNVTAVSPDPVPNVFKFIPNFLEIKNDFASAKDFVVSLDCSVAKVDRLAYKNIPEENKLNIVLTPKQGNFSPEDVTFSYGSFHYDLIIVLDSPDLERLGTLYDKEAELFYETPIVNIDHHPGNDYFGKVNWIELTATSTAEILVAFLESLGRENNLINADIATCLLAGIITDTGSFQNSNTTPKSFTVAAQLIAAGARQQEIVRSIYKTKPLTTLKLWGKILSNIREERDHKFIWSEISKGELDQLGAGEQETSGVIDELLKTAPGIDFALLLSEKKNGVHGSLRGVNKGVNVVEVANIFDGGGHELAAAFFLTDTTLMEARDAIINKIQNLQAQKHSLPEANDMSSAGLTQNVNTFSENSVKSEAEEISERFSSM